MNENKEQDESGRYRYLCAVKRLNNADYYYNNETWAKRFRDSGVSYESDCRIKLDYESRQLNLPIT